MDLRPSCYDNINGYFWTLAYQQKFKESKHFLDSICNVTDCDKFCVHLKFQNHTLLGEYEQAEESFRKMSDIGTNPFILDSTKIALVYIKLGHISKADAIIKSIKESYENTLDLKKYWVLNYALASVHSIMGNKDEALQYLSNAVDAGIDYGNLNFLEIDPVFQDLWNDPKYKAILKRAQEEKAYIRAHFKLLEEKGEFDL
jgi:tetratricopeptide (TPR) repeat protein